jgi:predicted RNA-binding Zn-ribbon protein involved in translation (DUF1610 family)
MPLQTHRTFEYPLDLMTALVPTGFQHLFDCPHCGKTIQSPFGTGDLTGRGDTFPCPHCQRIVAMSLTERVNHIARREARRGQIWVVVAGIAIGFPVARALVRIAFPRLTPLGWAVTTLMAAFIVFHFRVDRIQGLLWQEIEPQRSTEAGDRSPESGVD